MSQTYAPAKTMNFHRYRPYEVTSLPDRTWPDKVIEKAPIWCSVDLRDGNQALIDPMNGEEKMRMFRTLVEIGFKEIEVGFPAASQTDFDFVRALIEQDLIPDDVTIQVLTQCREELIEETFRALKGTKRAIVHMYNSTSELQRRVVFQLDRAGIVEIAVKAAKIVKRHIDAAPETNWRVEYSPESFTGTEMDFAVEICEAVMDVFQPTPAKRLILNLPATVEMSTPNVYADRIEWFLRHIKNRDSIILSLHPHNDRGTGVAAAELGVLAGADRVEGTLFGNGERTGNVCAVTLAINMMSQGVDPKLDFTDIDRVVKVAESCTKLPVPERHPYAGELVFTAFSGSHQDAIKKGFAALKERNDDLWEVPYLPIDPMDVGRNYEAVVRINSQSGKGGVAYLLEEIYGIAMPRPLQVDFSKVVQEEADRTSKELDTITIWRLFREAYLENDTPVGFIECAMLPDRAGCRIEAKVSFEGRERAIAGTGTGPIDAYLAALETLGVKASVKGFHEHAIQKGSSAEAAAYIEVEGENGVTGHGAGTDRNIVTASLKGVTSAVNRMLKAA
ncbi:MAG: 2-isopropylmalate synthase [Parvibaculaceae bacterium]|nr:2-isopropylmalate synthase [Parvibaculaceae bacterium]